jgi:hypothetical protein
MLTWIDASLCDPGPAMNQAMPPDRLIELRAYRAAPGQGQALVDLFEAHFLDAYEASGARIEASFKDADCPDRWVWIRSFSSPQSRGEVLARFYGCEAWKRHGRACNALMASVEWARLLACEDGESRLAAVLPERGNPALAPSVAPGNLWQLDILPQRCGTLPQGEGLRFKTDPSANFYPRQPVLKTPVSVCLTPAGAVPGGALALGANRFCLAPTSRSRLR